MEIQHTVENTVQDTVEGMSQPEAPHPDAADDISGGDAADAVTTGDSADAVTTGDVDDAAGDALRRLERVSELPLDERPDEFQAIHDHLRDALAAIDDA